MICTFGDVTDVVWWRELGLPVRAVIQANGAFKPVVWGERGWESEDPVRAQVAYDQLAGLSAVKARARIVELLRASEDLVGEPRPITHQVKFYEKGDRPLEIVTSRQWFIRTMEFRERLLEQRSRDPVASAVHAGAARELDQRAERATGASAGSASSACRFRSGTRSARTAPSTMRRRLLPDESRLPIDPSTDVPDGFIGAAARSARAVLPPIPT